MRVVLSKSYTPIHALIRAGEKGGRYRRLPVTFAIAVAAIVLAAAPPAYPRNANHTRSRLPPPPLELVPLVVGLFTVSQVPLQVPLLEVPPLVGVAPAPEVEEFEPLDGETVFRHDFPKNARPANNHGKGTLRARPGANRLSAGGHRPDNTSGHTYRRGPEGSAGSMKWLTIRSAAVSLCRT